MANEVEIITLLGNNGDPVEWDVADGTALPFGTIMKISSSPQVAEPSTADGDLLCGIVSATKEANDGITKVALYTNVIANVTATASTGSMTLGKPVKITGANTVAPADDDTVANSAEVLGIAYETVSAGGTGAVRVKL